MGTFGLRCLVLAAVVLPSVAQAQDAYQLDMPTQIDPWVLPQPVVTIDEDGNSTVNTPASDILDYQGVESVDPWLDRFFRLWLILLLWLVTPICLLLEAFLDWMGFAQTLPNPFDFSTGSLGLWASIANAWFPFSETIYFATSALVVKMIWTPFKIIIKYMIPGLG